MYSSSTPRRTWASFLIPGFLILLFIPTLLFGQSTILTLKQAVETALQKNPALLGARYELRATEWDVKGSYFNLLPRVDVEFGYLRLDNATVRRANIFYDVSKEYFADIPGVNPDDIRPSAWLDSYGTRISVVQPIYNGGANWAGVSLAQAAKNRQFHTLRESEQDIIFRVQQAYFNVLHAQAMVALMEETVHSSREHLRTTERMLELGLRSKADALRWEVQLADDEGNLITSENQLAIGRIALNNVMGVDFSRTFELQPITMETRDAEESLPALIDKAMDYHPGLQAVGSTVDMQKADVRLAWSSFLPKVNFLYSYGWERNNTLSLDSIEDWNASLSVNIPIFHSLSEYASVKRSKAQLKSVQHAEEEYRRAVVMQLTTAFLTLKSALKKVSIMEKTVEQARENLRIMENKYEVGMASNVEVIDVQVACTGAQANAITALHDYYMARAELDRATGLIGMAEVR